MSFLENPWAIAENAVFRKLVEATGTVERRTAFQGFLPPAGNVWALKVGGGGDVRNTWGGNITELRMDADIEGMFLERGTAQLFALKVLQTLPLGRMENVQCFRLRANGMPDVKFKEITLGNEDKPRFIWSVIIGCEIVFNTVEQANVAHVG